MYLINKNRVWSNKHWGTDQSFRARNLRRKNCNCRNDFCGYNQHYLGDDTHELSHQSFLAPNHQQFLSLTPKHQDSFSPFGLDSKNQSKPRGWFFFQAQAAGPEPAVPAAALPDSNLVFPKPLPWLAPQVRMLSHNQEVIGTLVPVVPSLLLMCVYIETTHQVIDSYHKPS